MMYEKFYVENSMNTLSDGGYFLCCMLSPATELRKGKGFYVAVAVLERNLPVMD